MKDLLNFREATIIDIQAMHVIRMSVRENVLSNPTLVTSDDYEKYITREGKGWVCEINGEIVGFAIIDVVKRNIWALFVDPAHEKKRIGLQLQQLMLNWYFNQSKDELNLSTTPGTRAEHFYRKSGWREEGQTKSGEIIFRLHHSDWSQHA